MYRPACSFSELRLYFILMKRGFPSQVGQLGFLVTEFELLLTSLILEGMNYTAEVALYILTLHATICRPDLTVDRFTKNCTCCVCIANRSRRFKNKNSPYSRIGPISRSISFIERTRIQSQVQNENYDNFVTPNKSFGFPIVSQKRVLGFGSRWSCFP